MIDQEGADFRRGERTIGYCFTCAPYAFHDSTYFNCREIIDGREAYIVRGRGTDGRYMTAGNWINRHGLTLVLVALGPDKEGDREGLATIRSVRLKKHFDERSRP